MIRLALATLLVINSSMVLASDKACFIAKYDSYVDASLQWYKDLVAITTEQNPDLYEAGQWFLDGRKNHFELNREAVHYFLNNEPSHVKTERSVESWLLLQQSDVKLLSTRTDKLGKVAQKTFNDRQSENHPKNYALRSAFADLLSHPKNIEPALAKYNQSIENVENKHCE
ncbi:hypothetical protein [Vibrio sagamiensis]|uniref:Uncharacterized protein n=1 Tax=Vibrio sagamiensis NBRC 104589 TaxID=1219064 RepID=A0A511QE29_9VIBR|nr:hypothetical protein [Vibrio sagamiensis]PNQ61907.1 hypothetical protein C1141_11020 [Vibrio agarivorans]GEM75568.1 hypothetical protein VSA01S_16800 [Vibrio sagamiensis NBRC 104589]